eukprot:1152052-Pelagomonas_calceolata.AAC.2
MPGRGLRPSSGVERGDGGAWRNWAWRRAKHGLRMQGPDWDLASKLQALLTYAVRFPLWLPG